MSSCRATNAKCRAVAIDWTFPEDGTLCLSVFIRHGDTVLKYDGQYDSKLFDRPLTGIVDTAISRLQVVIGALKSCN